MPETRSFDPRTEANRHRLSAQNVPEPQRPELTTQLDETFFGTDARKLRELATQDFLIQPLDQSPLVRQLDLRTAIQRAVVSNLDVKVAGYAPGIEETRVVEAEARFDPTWFSNVSFERRNSLTPAGLFGSGPGGLSVDEQDLGTAQTGIRQLLQSGGEVRLQYQTQTIDFKGPANRDFNPTWLNEASLQITQPLLRDFGNEINRARILINRNTQQISVLDFRLRLEETIFDIERTYWQLHQATVDARILQRLVERTFETTIITAGRGANDADRTQISQANAELETRRVELSRALSRVGVLSDQLKRLINDPALPVGGPELIVPTTEPADQPIVYTWKEQIDAALLNRAEVGQQLKRVDSALIALGVARNNLLPRVDLIAEGTLQGASDEFYSAVGEQVDLNDEWYYSARVGLQVEVPLGNRAARAVMRRAQLQHWQAIASYQSLAQQVTSEVTQSIRQVEESYTAFVLARRARFAAEESLKSLEFRRENGEPLTPGFVDLLLRSQERLASLARSETSSVADYNAALAQLERTKGTLLRYNNVLIQEEAMSSGR
jgi:outer membrane protein TolC